MIKNGVFELGDIDYGHLLRSIVTDCSLALRFDGAVLEKYGLHDF